MIAKGREAAHTDALGRQTTCLHAANDVDLLEVRRVDGASTELLGSFSGYTAERGPTTDQS